MIRIEDVHIQYRTQDDPLNEKYERDGLTAALAKFTFHVAIKGYAILSNQKLQVTVEELGVYVKDLYDFLDKDLNLYDQMVYGSQYLDNWSEGIGEVLNKTFNEWRERNNRGGDFLIYSDIKVTKLVPPDVFDVPL